MTFYAMETLLPRQQENFAISQLLVYLITMVTTVTMETKNCALSLSSSYLTQIFFVTICINEQACCYGNTVTMQ